MNNICNILKEHATDKEEAAGHSYGEVYEKLFKRFNRTDKLNLLELGVERGGSLYAWKEIFPNATITGVDMIDKREERFKTDSEIKFIRGELRDVMADFDKKFDIIIDDSDHSSPTMAWIARHYFPLLKKKGILIFEDVQIPEEYIKAIGAEIHDGIKMEVYDQRPVKGRHDDFIVTLTHV